MGLGLITLCCNKVTPSGFATNVSCNFLVVFGLEAVGNYEDMKVVTKENACDLKVTSDEFGYTERNKKDC